MKNSPKHHLDTMAVGHVQHPQRVHSEIDPKLAHCLGILGVLPPGTRVSRAPDESDDHPGDPLAPIMTRGDAQAWLDATLSGASAPETMRRLLGGNVAISARVEPPVESNDDNDDDDEPEVSDAAARARRLQAEVRRTSAAKLAATTPKQAEAARARYMTAVRAMVTHDQKMRAGHGR